MPVDIERLFGPTTIPYETVELTADQARELEIDGSDELITAIDNAQGEVYGDARATEAYVIIRITK